MCFIGIAINLEDDRLGSKFAEYGAVELGPPLESGLRWQRY